MVHNILVVIWVFKVSSKIRLFFVFVLFFSFFGAVEDSKWNLFLTCFYLAGLGEAVGIQELGLWLNWNFEVGDQLTGKRVEQYAEEEQKKEGRNL